MVYTKTEDKAQIKKAFNMFLVEHGTNLHQFCKDYGYSYAMIYQKLTVNNISDDLINEMIAKIDKTRTIQRVNKKLVITKIY